MWKNYFSQLLKLHRVSDIRQKEVLVDTAELLTPDSIPFQVEIAIAKLKGYKSPGSDVISAEVIQTGCEILSSKIHELMDSIWNKEERYNDLK
jgi:hypothetical protein